MDSIKNYEDAINRCIDYIEKYECDNVQIANLKCIIGWTYLIDLNNRELGREALIEAIEANEMCERAYTGLGIYEANNKNFEEAIDYFNKAIEINKDDGENYFALAICYKELKVYDLIEEYLIKANNSQITDSEIDTLLKDTRQKKIVITEKGKKFKKNLLKKYKNLKND